MFQNVFSNNVSKYYSSENTFFVISHELGLFVDFSRTQIDIIPGLRYSLGLQGIFFVITLQTNVSLPNIPWN